MEALSENTGDFWVEATVPILENPSVVEFLREAYSKYHPVIIRGAIADWPALRKWDKQYLIEHIHDKVCVNITPDGMADSVKLVQDKECFTYPAEMRMSMTDFYTMIESTDRETAVAYLSEQNDNLRLSMSDLLDDIHPPSIVDAFGESNLPEAVNMWIGDEKSVSSMHKDHFENMYCVVSGEKCFTLLPPTDIAFLPEDEYTTLRYALKHGHDYNNPIIKKEDLELVNQGPSTDTLRWIGLDPDDPEACARYPNSINNLHPIRCKVQAGEVLYIPSMWLHRVTQSRLTVAVNYWFDMRFDFR